MITKNMRLVFAAGLCVATTIPTESFAIAIGGGGTTTAFQLDVTYSQPSILSGSPDALAFGLSSLPDTVSATFIVRGGAAGAGLVTFGLNDVDYFDLPFGNEDWTTIYLGSFFLTVDLTGPSVTDLSYEAEKCRSADCRLAANFPLTISGTEGGDSFEYQYADAAHVLSPAPVPEPSSLAILAASLVGLLFFRRKSNLIA